MRNFSLVGLDVNKECSIAGDSYFVISVVPKQYLGSRFISAHYVTDHLNKLRIVGCGKKGLSSLPFEDLTYVYDQFVWLGICISGLCIAIAIKFLIRNTFDK